MMREVKEVRKDYLEEFATCQVCGASPSVAIHEITRGPHRAEALSQRTCWLAVCMECHREIHDLAHNWPIERQCALKAIRDPAFFSLSDINRIRGRSPGAITWFDLTPYWEFR